MEWAYIAGMIDGEGHLTRSRNRGGHFIVGSPRIQITNQCLAALEAMQQVTGGSIGLADKTKETPVYRLTIAGRLAARHTLKAVLPYLIVKRALAEELLAEGHDGPHERLPLSDDERLIIRRLSDEGKTQREIASVVRRSPGTVCRVLKR